MFNLTNRARLVLTASAIALLAAFAADPAYAVEQTARLQGNVANATAGMTITAVNQNTGERVQGQVRSDGSYIFLGLRPGNYEITAGTDKESVRLSVGTTATLNLDASAAATETVVVSGTKVAQGFAPQQDIHASEIATSISQMEIQKLPQLDRNFLGFAATAPGVIVQNTGIAGDKTFSAGGGSTSRVNVFIDGQSMKNQVLAGGVAGETNSRGNPFPLAAIDEYKVSTQNFKAEYEQAGTAIITAVTKTGGDDFHGDLFEEYQSKDMVGQPYYSRGAEKPDYSRHQYGANFSGPIIEGKLHFLLAYEAVDQNTPTTPYNFSNPLTPPELAKLTGTASAGNFHQKMPFAKFTWDVDDNNTIDLTLMDREESDRRDFGNNATYSAGHNLNQFVRQGTLNWKHRAGDVLNEMSFEVQAYHWKQSNLDNSPNITLVDTASTAGCTVHCNVVALTGGNQYHQKKSQDNFTFKDNLTYAGINWYGQHVLKAGIKIAHYSYSATEALHQYLYDAATYNFGGSNTPIAAQVNVGSPEVKSSNMQLGVFIQDDWTVDQHLTVNVGLRWDYETNMFDNNFITPPDVATAIRGWSNFKNAGFNPEDYISNGGNRTATAGMFQPRLGASYDLEGDGETVFFAGAGRYYDRDIYDNTQLEYRRSYASQYTLLFGSGAGQVPWDPAYLDPAKLESLGAVSGAREIFALKNNNKVPYTDQFNIGIRQKFGWLDASVTYAHIEGYHNFNWMLGNRQPDGSWCVSGPQYACQPWGFGLPGFGNFIISNDSGRTHYNAVYLTASKAYTETSPWGFSSTLTIANARALGNDNDAFNFDVATPEAGGWHAASGVDRYRWVTSAVVDGPWGTSLSGLVTLASGAPFGRADCRAPACRLNQSWYYPKGLVNYKQIDLRLSKTFDTFEGQNVTLDFQVYNVFDWINRTYSQWVAGFSNDTTSATLQPDKDTTGPARTFQLGIKYHF
jgi:outer membrane receptor for ferrienterochelin and colicin